MADLLENGRSKKREETYDDWESDSNGIKKQRLMNRVKLRDDTFDSIHYFLLYTDLDETDACLFLFSLKFWFNFFLSLLPYCIFSHFHHPIRRQLSTSSLYSLFRFSLQSSTFLPPN